MSPIRILLAEDHDIVREGTRQVLQKAQDLEVVGEAGDGDEAMQLAEDLRPDVLVMDVRMPRLNGLQATRRIKARHPEIRVLILSAYEDDQYVFPLLEAGADGYLLKTAKVLELVGAIRAVHSGRKVLAPSITDKVVSHLAGEPHGYGSAEMVETLTERELEVLQAVASGKSNREIADALFLSTNTVQVHLRNIFGKLGVGSRTEAVTHALREGLISLRKKPGA
ncbi:MAG: response regulator transcription factor [Bacteroidetes bacterium]|nr:response regulator transcription factor [Bacteroidota bacterium]